MTVVVAILVRDHHWPVLAALGAGSCSAAAAGLLNGGLISGLGVVPFIITLGSLKVFRGVAKWLSDSTPVYIPGKAKGWWFHEVMAVERPVAGLGVGAPGPVRRPWSGS